MFQTQYKTFMKVETQETRFIF